MDRLAGKKVNPFTVEENYVSNGVVRPGRLRTWRVRAVEAYYSCLYYCNHGLHTILL
jgi:hypothetical protein